MMREAGGPRREPPASLTVAGREQPAPRRLSRVRLKSVRGRNVVIELDPLLPRQPLCDQGVSDIKPERQTHLV